MSAVVDVCSKSLWRCSVERYHAMIDAGIVGADDRVELLDGLIVDKMSKNPPHSAATRAGRKALERIVPAGWFVDDQEPITLSGSEPEPDLAVIRGDDSHYSARHPGPSDVGLVVEISDATLDRDRILKKRIYATAGIPCYWLVNLVYRRIEVYSDPKSCDYSRCDVYRPEDSAPVILDGCEVGSVAVSTLLP
jgi:Uma2 family endonuclease